MEEVQDVAVEHGKGHPSVFEQANRVFEGWDDPETGLRVLKLADRDRDVCPQVAAGGLWHTPYHQCRCFLEGGRKVVLSRSVRPGGGPHDPTRRPGGPVLMDLTTGEATAPFPEGLQLVDTCDAAGTAALLIRSERELEVQIWDTRRAAVLASLAMPGWKLSTDTLLSDGQRMIAGFYQGRFRHERCRTRFYLFGPDVPARKVLDEDGYCCNHAVGCPTDPDLYAYDKWPTPDRAVEVVNHIRNVDGSFEIPLPLREDTVRPGPLMECNRDHYVWTPDGARIASYLLPQAEDFSTNHYTYHWWISVTNWRTGEDVSVPYPPERWGGHFQVTPDSRHLVSGGGQRFHYLYAIDIEGLRRGWNERILCRYPGTPPDEHGSGVDHHPHVLPDGSGILFTAGHQTPEHGVYLVQWPADL